MVVTGRFDGGGKATVRVHGKMSHGESAFEIPADLDAADGVHPGISSVWARKQISVLMDDSYRSPKARRVELAQAVRQVALEYSLLSGFTAFIAVDSLSKTVGEHGTTVPVPVPVPAGVKYDTTVPE